MLPITRFRFRSRSKVFGGQFSPASLFAAGEPGTWYDPSDLTTLFEDAAGTTPVPSVLERPVGLMLDKSKGLVLGSELVTNGDFSTDTAWTKETGWTIAGGAAVASSVVSFAAIYQSASVVAGRAYRVSFTVSGYSAGQVYVYAGSSGFGIARSANGTFTQYIFASGTGQISLRGTNSFTGSIDNISVKELPGNHAFQSTPADRPTLSARYNLITGSDGFTSALITPATGIVVVATGQQDPRGGFTARQIRNTTTNEQHRLYFGVTSAGRHTYSVEVKDVDAGFVQLSMAGTVVAATGATFNLSTGAYTLVGSTQPTASVETLANGFLRLSITAPATETQTSNVQLYVLESEAASVNPTTTGTAKSVIVAGADLRVSNDGVGIPAYQRVNTATDYDTTGFPPYLAFNGSTRWMQTNTITPGTDKAQVFAGVRKLSDAAQGTVAEFSSSLAANNGAFTLSAPNGAASNYSFVSKGTAAATAIGTPFAAPITSVLTGLGDIAGDVSTVRVNGSATTDVTDQGTGNYLAYPLYIGRRGGASLPLNGRIYSLITRFGPNLTAAQITSTETYVNTKTKAT